MADLNIGGMSRVGSVACRQPSLESPLSEDSVEKVGVSTRPEVSAPWLRLSKCRRGGPHHPSQTRRRAFFRAETRCRRWFCASTMPRHAMHRRAAEVNAASTRALT